MSWSKPASVPGLDENLCSPLCESPSLAVLSLSFIFIYLGFFFFFPVGWGSGVVWEGLPIQGFLNQPSPRFLQSPPCVKNLHGWNPRPCMMSRHWSCTSHDDKLLKDLHRKKKKKKAKDRYIQSKKNKRRIKEFLVYFCTLLAFFSCLYCLRDPVRTRNVKLF